jgi:hypothetical protein
MPGDLPDSDDESFYTAVGHLAVAWASLEMLLDMLVITIHHALGGKDFEAVEPWALKRKIKYVRLCCEKIHRLEPYKQQLLPLMDKLTTASDTRHKIIHGRITSNPRGAAIVKMVRRIRGGTKPFERVAYEISPQQIYKDVGVVLDLSDKLVPILETILDRTIEEIQQAAGKGTG